VQADLEWDLGFANLSLLPAFLHTDANDRFYNSGPTSVAQSVQADQPSVELRLASSGDGPLKWIAGFYYQEESQSSLGYYEGTSPVPLLINNWGDVTDTSYAGFAQATYSLTDNFRLTGGVRYTVEEKDSKDGTNTFTYIPSLSFLTSTLPNKGNQSWYHTTWRAGVEYDVAPQSMLYANVSTGFHAGGLQPGAKATKPTDQPDSYQPEDLTAYAVGVKNRFFNNTVQLNVEGYWWDYRNLQVSDLGPINPAAQISVPFPPFSITSYPTGFRINNAGKARLYGVEANLEWRVTPADLLSLTALYNNSKYVDYAYNRQINILGSPVVVPQNNTGKRMTDAPMWSGTVAYQHTFDLGDHGQLIAGVSTQFQSSAVLWYQAPPQVDTLSPGYTRTDLTLTYAAPSGWWTLTGYVRNVEDGADIVMSQGGNGPATNSPWVLLQAPRTFGASINVRF
jgi:iron complex outermembrane receptor protein